MLGPGACLTRGACPRWPSYFSDPDETPFSPCVVWICSIPRRGFSRSSHFWPITALGVVRWVGGVLQKLRRQLPYDGGLTCPGLTLQQQDSFVLKYNVLTAFFQQQR
eukprot:EG_transcript_45976